MGKINWSSVLAVIPLMIGTLPALIIATLVGAKLYKE